ncbi:MAG: nitroreductase [Alphaproteobacteria bacterium]|nr:nitroreductase [Alphaproteobacteria bacterium]
MDVVDAVKSRISTRAFLNTPIDDAEIRSLLNDARWSPSGGNLQPWRVHVVTGDARNRLVAGVKDAIAANPFADEAELAIYPPGLWEPYRSRRFAIGEAMYEKLGVGRNDKPARLQWLLQNYEFFGAPVGLFFSTDRRFDRGQWAHLGMFMQTIALLAEERGLATCMQEAWATRAKTVSAFLDLADEEMLYCGMALGRANPAAPVNSLRSDRAPLDEIATFHVE